MQYGQIALYLTLNKNQVVAMTYTEEGDSNQYAQNIPHQGLLFQRACLQHPFHLPKCPAPRGKSRSPYLWDVLESDPWNLSGLSFACSTLAYSPEAQAFWWSLAQTRPRPQGLCTWLGPAWVSPPVTVWFSPLLLASFDSVKPLLSILRSHSSQERELTWGFKRENLIEKLLAKYEESLTR